MDHTAVKRSRLAPTLLKVAVLMLMREVEAVKTVQGMPVSSPVLPKRQSADADGHQPAGAESLTAWFLVGKP